MTVSNTTSRNQYTATSGQTVFPYTFEVFDKTDIVVLQNGSAIDEGTDYTVSGVGNDNGGNITLLVGATTGDIITIYRDMPLQRLTDYQTSGDFLAQEVNDDFDRLWLATQQINDGVTRVIRAPDTDSVSINLQLPVAADRATKLLSFDANGSVSTVLPTSGAVTDSANVSFTQEGTGAVARVVQDKLRDVRSVKDFGAKGDGFTDDADAIQAAIDSFEGTVYFPKGTYVIKKPIYLKTRSVLKGEGDASIIRKDTTVVGEGSNTSPSTGGLTDSYAVNAAIIVKHDDNAFAYYVGIHDLRIQGDSAYRTDYGIYAPRMSQSSFTNVRIYRAKTGFYTNDTWQTSFTRVTIDPEKMRDPLASQKGIGAYGPTDTCIGFYFDTDGGGGGTGTSCTFDTCYARRCDRGYELQALNYSSLTNCAADQMNQTAYKFENCGHLTMISCAMEDSIASPGLLFSAGEYNVIGFRAASSIYGTPSGSAQGMYDARSSARVTFINSELNFSTANLGLIRVIQSGAQVTEMDTLMPTTGNTYITFSGGASLTRYQADDIRYSNEEFSAPLNNAELSLGLRKRRGQQYFDRARTLASGATNIATITMDNSGTADRLTGKMKMNFEDSSSPYAAGYLEIPFAVYRYGSNYFSDVGTAMSAFAGDAGFTTAPAVSFTRSGLVWTLVITTTHGTATAVELEAETYSSGATFAWT